MLTFLEYQSAARRTQNPALTRHAKRDHALLGLAAEIGEILGHFQKTFQSHRLDPGAVAALNFGKLRKRYPDGFDAEKSVNREADDK